MKLSFALFTAAMALTAHAKLDLHKQNNVVVYWGQNARGQQQSQPRLREFCDDDTVDVIPVAYITTARPTANRPPETNFANACQKSYPDHPNVLHCPEIGEDIKYCQSKGKTVLISTDGNYDSQDKPNGTALADLVWDMYLGGDGSITGLRPFGKDVVMDGVDLAFKYWTNHTFDHFVGRMKKHYKGFSSKPMWVSASPRCMFPDVQLADVLENSDIDLLFVNFSNEPCGVGTFEPGKSIDDQTHFNWKMWNAYARGGDTGTWYKNHMKNSNVSIFMGHPGGEYRFDKVFAPPAKLREIISEVKKYHPFAGISIWDASLARDYKTDNGKNMLQAMRGVLDEETSH